MNPAEKYLRQPSTVNAQQHFTGVPEAEIQRSRFDRSSGLKTTFNAGNLIPVFCDEVLPGDTYHMHATLFTRLATPLKPVMDNVYQDVHFFFVPARLVWENWKAFMGERKNLSDNPDDYSIPQATWAPTAALTHANGAAFAIGDYLGLPKAAGFGAETVNVSALPLRAIQLIWNEWYRDENLQEPIDISFGNTSTGWNYNTTVANLPRGKRKDYFTSALPWPQKGDAVVVPIGDSANLVAKGAASALSPGVFKFGQNGNVVEVRSGVNTLQGDLQTSGATPNNLRASGFSGGATDAWLRSVYSQFESDASFVNRMTQRLEVDLSGATSVPINDLRTAFQIQRLLERDARGGTRYIEQILAHFKVVNPDFRLQRPEYLGGSTGNVNIHPVTSTYATEGGSPQGNLAATATGVTQGGFSHSFTEHGYVIGLTSVRADLTYQRGIERMWSRTTRYDYYWPAFAHLGEQAILNKELFLAPAAAGTNDQVFGYQERFAEYRYKPGRITGLMASEENASLDVWHLSQDFTSLPALNPTFIVENPPIDRVIAVPSEPQFLMDAWFSLQCDRPMPVYSVPGLIDHF